MVAFEKSEEVEQFAEVELAFCKGVDTTGAVKVGAAAEL